MSICASLRKNVERAVWSMVVVAVPCFGCSDAGHRLGGETVEAGNVFRPQTVNRCATGTDIELLDDMEDGDAVIKKIHDRAGTWFTFNDETSGRQFPVSNKEIFVMSELEPPVGRSHWAARSYGGQFSDWGAGIGFEFNLQLAYDVSGYAGITFLARRGPESTDRLRFGVADVATAPRGEICHDLPEGKHCSDYFGATLLLSTQFERYSFLWEDLAQVGWGIPQPPALDTKQTYGVRFQVDRNEDFDFWIDDIALCKYE